MLSQIDADNLVKTLKFIVKPTKVRFPQPGESTEIDIRSVDKKNKFLLDINRGRVKLVKCTYQNRYRKDIVLLRLDINGSPHTNPDGKTIPCPHLHIYREGFGDKWAVLLPDDFSDNMDIVTKLFEFMDYCKIDNATQLNIQGVI